MRLLLDTHALLWAITEQDRLSPAVRDRLLDRRNELVVSVATPWEIAIKYRMGKLPAGESIISAYPDALAELGAVELPMTSRHSITAGLLPWDHKDPFDRILAAQSIVEDLSLVTSDRVFEGLPGVRAIW